MQIPPSARIQLGSAELLEVPAALLKVPVALWEFLAALLEVLAAADRMELQFHITSLAEGSAAVLSIILARVTTLFSIECC